MNNMGPFDDDFLRELLNHFSSPHFEEYGSSDSDGKRKLVKRFKRNISGKIFLNKVEGSKNSYFIFDLSDKTGVIAKLKKDASGNKIIQVEDDQDLLFEFQLEEVNIKDFESKFKNGILEVSFRK
jgi:hypothetical protein